MIAVYSVTNTVSMSIENINDEYVDVVGFCGDKHHYKIKYTNGGRAYFTYCNGCRYHIDEFIRV